MRSPRSDVIASARRWVVWLDCRWLVHSCDLRQVGVAGIARTVRTCLGQGARRRHLPRSTIASQLESPARCKAAFRRRHGPQAFPPLD
jgi:hypothetical protein